MRALALPRSAPIALVLACSRVRRRVPLRRNATPARRSLQLVPRPATRQRPHPHDGSPESGRQRGDDSGRTVRRGRERNRNLRLNPCTQTIDLRGRTVVPGLIDNHNHIVLLGMRPGHDVRLDRVFSLDDLRAAIQARAQNVAGRRMDHRDGRLEPAAVCGEALADDRGTRRRRAEPSGDPLSGLQRSRRHQHARQDILRESRRRGRRRPARSPRTRRRSPRSMRCAQSRRLPTRSAARSTPWPTSPASG